MDFPFRTISVRSLHLQSKEPRAKRSMILILIRRTFGAELAGHASRMAGAAET
jgi:hypothetical protein